MIAPETSTLTGQYQVIGALSDGVLETIFQFKIKVNEMKL
jgi:hypothetical protein